LNDEANLEVARWVIAAKSGSTSAHEMLYRRHVGLVHGILLSRHRRAVAEELTQECFIIAFQRIRQLRDPAKFAPWLAAIARHAKSESDPSQMFGDQLDELLPDASDPAVGVEAINILNAIRRLPDAYRETMVLRLVEGMSGAEIAAATDLSADSVRVNLHRGMQKLREMLGIATAASKLRSDR
jgi:RNA polymerase sigma-70 factor, ECF subfamily